MDNKAIKRGLIKNLLKSKNLISVAFPLFIRQVIMPKKKKR